MDGIVVTDSTDVAEEIKNILLMVNQEIIVFILL